MTLHYKDTLFSGAELDQAVKKAREDEREKIKKLIHDSHVCMCSLDEWCEPHGCADAWFDEEILSKLK